MEQFRCFLCRVRRIVGNDFKSIESTICPGSKKSTKDVINYIARCAKTELHIHRNGLLCLNCYDKVVEFDCMLMKTLKKQRFLSQMVEKAVVSVYTEIEQECNDHMATMEEISDKELFGDTDISEYEIDQTMRDVMSGRKESRKKEQRHQLPAEHHNRPPRELIQCGLCAMRFKSKARLQRHISQAHKKYSCDLCTFSHRNEDYVLLHMNIHQGRSENQCRFCGKMFTTKISTIRHMEVHFDTKKYQCDKCGLCFSQTTILYNHKLQHEAEEHPLRCEICNQIFKTKRTYRHHMITHRADRPRYSCEFCGKTFTEKYTLKVHKRTHTDNSCQEPVQEQPQLTTIIDDAVQIQSNLNVIEAKFNCIICDQMFTNKDQLNKHMEKEHDVILKSLTVTNFTQYDVVANEAKKPCHICGHMFNTQSNLDYHLEHLHGVSFK